MNLTVEYCDVPNVKPEKIKLISSGAQSFSGPAILTTRFWGASGKYATLEENGWLLNGSMELMADPPSNCWWSARVSDEEGWLPEPAVLELYLPERVSTTGLSFSFSASVNQWCSRIRVSWYNGNLLLQQGEFYPDTFRWTLRQTTEGFDRVRIELLQTNLPGHFAKLERLVLGQIWNFEDADILHAEFSTTADPTLRQIKPGKMLVKVHTTVQEPMLPQEGQQLKLYQDGGLLATHYITGSRRLSGQVYLLQAQSCTGFLEDRFMGGMYSGRRLKRLLDNILGEDNYELTKRLEDIQIFGHLPVCTRNEALQQVAIAVGAMVCETPTGLCKIFPVSQVVENVMTASDALMGASMANGRRYSKVEVAEHIYEFGDTPCILLDQEPVYGTRLFLFDRPYHSYNITGGQIVEQNVNFVRIEAEGPVTLEAYPYLHGIRIHSKSDPQVVGRQKENVLQLLDATLVGKRNVQAVLQQQYATSRLWQTLEADSVQYGLLSGQKITAVTPWSTHAQGYITAMKRCLTPSGYVASVQIRGVEKTREIVCRYSGEIYSADGEVLY